METNEPLIEKLQVIIHWSVRTLAILMVFVIVMGVVDVAWTPYQKLISPMIGPHCRYHPTCSEYFIQAVHKYGVLFGTWKGICRILRCHPWHPGGDDPP